MHDDLIVMTTASGIRGCGRRMGVIHNLRRVALDSAPVGHLDLSAAFRAYGDRIVGERLLLGEVVVAVLATVMVSRHDILALRTIPNFLTGHILVRSLRRPRNRPILGHRHNHPA